MATPTFPTRGLTPAAPAAPAGTVLGAGLTIEGELTSSEPVTIDGTFTGRIAATEAVVVGAGAQVEADIEATSVRVLGAVTGNVVATERVEIGTDWKLVGDLRAGRISIADGATFRGRIEMDG